MKLLDRLDRRFGRYAVPHVTVSLIFCQVLLFLAHYGNPDLAGAVELIPRRVLQGEVWRLVAFLFRPFGPENIHPIWAFFFWYLFYMMGTALEQTWGIFRYNVFLLIGYAATVGVSFLQLDVPASPMFLQGSVFLAFAYLYPDFKLTLFFLLPVKIKWLAMLQWIGYGFMLLFGAWMVRLMVMASILNFLLFFGSDILRRMRGNHRRMRDRAQKIATQNTPRHRCAVCGIDNLSHPTASFRYCSKCSGAQCYCEEHLQDHAHTAEQPEELASREAPITGKVTRRPDGRA